MKKLIKYLTISCVISSIACNGFLTEPKGNTVGILVDLSDTFKQVNDLSIEELKPIFTINKNPYAPAKCILATITSLRYTETQKFSISGEREFESNIIERKRNIDTFYSQIEQTLKLLKSGTIGSNGSFVCYALSKMLLEISNCNDCQGKKVIVFSDLMEHTAFSVYDKKQYALLKTNPETVRQILDREYPLPPLGGIEIVFVHRPTNKGEDENFHTVSQFFKWYYGTCHKANVSVSATIPKE